MNRSILRIIQNGYRFGGARPVDKGVSILSVQPAQSPGQCFSKPRRGYCSDPPQIQYGGNYYLMFDLKMDATPEEIKTAYYRLSKRYHPDINKSADATERFSRLTAAYNTLSNKEERVTYDQWLSKGLGGYTPGKRNYPEPGEEKVGHRFGAFGNYYRRGR